MRAGRFHQYSDTAGNCSHGGRLGREFTDLQGYSSHTNLGRTSDSVDRLQLSSFGMLTYHIPMWYFNIHCDYRCLNRVTGDHHQDNRDAK
jgi:hypothetical protein